MSCWLDPVTLTVPVELYLSEEELRQSPGWWMHPNGEYGFPCRNCGREIRVRRVPRGRETCPHCNRKMRYNLERLGWKELRGGSPVSPGRPECVWMGEALGILRKYYPIGGSRLVHLKLTNRGINLSMRQIKYKVDRLKLRMNATERDEATVGEVHFDD